MAQMTKILETKALGNDKTEISLIRFFDGQVLHFVVPVGRDTFRACLQQWHKGALVQNAFPDLNANQREMLMTGFTEAEMDELGDN